MQKATYFDGSAIYSGFPYQSANGLGYDANQQQYLQALHVESEYHRPVCSLQSPGGSAALHKPSEISEGCQRSNGTQAPVPDIPDNNQTPTTHSEPSSPSSLNQIPSSDTTAKSPGHPSPTPGTIKQFFPWMKESRQNTKQKSCSTISGDYINIVTP